MLTRYLGMVAVIMAVYAPLNVFAFQMAPACSAEKMAELRAPASKMSPSVQLDCTATLEAGQAITKEIVILGASGSGVRLNCRGATLGSPDENPYARSSHQLVISPAYDRRNNVWIPPKNIQLFNCNLYGTLRINGMNADAALLSSRQANHTQRVQAAAPSHIKINNFKFIGHVDRIKMLVGVGVTNLTVARSLLTGSSDAVGLYIGDESSQILLEKNIFEIATTRREQVSLDGAAHVTIQNNIFRRFDDYGGIYIYRNCGELGRVRIQPPAFNTIQNNYFVYKQNNTTQSNNFIFNLQNTSPKPAVWIGSRNKGRTEQPEQCVLDDGLGIGSSLRASSQPSTERDEAQFNTVKLNYVLNANPQTVFINDDKNNTVNGNMRTVDVPQNWKGD